MLHRGGMMKILGVSGSHRKGQNSYRLLEEAMKGVREVNPSAETKIIEIAELKISPCVAYCAYTGVCGKEPFKCVVKDDLSMIFNEMKVSDAILIASPRYFIVPSKLQAFIERLYCVHYWTQSRNPSVAFPLRDKLCGLLTVSSGGYYSTISLLEHLEEFILYLHMRLVTTNMGPFRGVVGKYPVSEDSYALKHASTLGQLIAKVAVTLQKGREKEGS